jgi:GT2 family glycosyltransferase
MTANVLILTPVKSAAAHLPGYVAGLDRLTYPRANLALGLIEGDSTDDTYAALAAYLPVLRDRFRRVGLWRKDFGFQTPPGVHRWSPHIQVARRTVLAKARNHLLSYALAEDDDWVLWLDVDVVEYPPDIIETLLSIGRDILHPHCVKRYGGPTFDQNGWRDNGRVFLQDLRGGPDLVRLDAVGATMLLIRADLHRDGLNFPPYAYAHPRARYPSPLLGARRGELESEGLGLMAADMGHQCWGLPHLEILHVDESWTPTHLDTGFAEI